MSVLQLLEETAVIAPGAAAAGGSAANRRAAASSTSSSLTFQLQNLPALTRELDVRNNPASRARQLDGVELSELTEAVNRVVRFLKSDSKPKNMAHLSNCIRQLCALKRLVEPDEIVKELLQRGSLSMHVNQDNNEELITYNL
jgi:hypothetical protein